MRSARTMVGLIAAAWTCVAPAQHDPLATKGGWEAGLQASLYDYEEPDFARLEGARLGATVAYTFLGSAETHSLLEARYSYGELDYTGSGTLSNAPDYLLELRALAGRDHRVGRVVWAPYAGVGFRYLLSDIRGLTSTGHVGYRRKSHYYYIPLGVALRIPVGRQWAMVPQLEYDGFAHGSQRSYLDDTGLGLPAVTNHQTDGWGARAQLSFEGPRWSLGIWTQYWDIGDSDVRPLVAGLGVLEPANTTRESGVELRYRY